MKIIGWSSKAKKLEAENANLRKENEEMLSFVKAVLESNLNLVQMCLELEGIKSE